MYGVHLRNETVDKLVMLAGGDIELVSDSIRHSQEYRRWHWWQRKAWAADLANVVAYIVSRQQK